jgi:hypothetical protein
MNKKVMKNSILVRKEVTWIFAVAALFSGFMFMDTSLTGNVIINKQAPVSLISIVGLLLIACSIVLIAYSVKKK